MAFEPSFLLLWNTITLATCCTSLPNHCTHFLHIQPHAFFDWQLTYAGHSHRNGDHSSILSAFWNRAAQMMALLHSMHQMANNTLRSWCIWQLMNNNLSSDECCPFIGHHLSIVQLKPCSSTTFGKKFLQFWNCFIIHLFLNCFW